MSEFGPLPEQPVHDERVALLDLRDRIRLEYNVPPLTPLGQAVDKERARLKAQKPKINKKLIDGILAIALLVTWSVKPVLVLVLIVILLVFYIARR